MVQDALHTTLSILVELIVVIQHNDDPLPSAFFG
jgi:hypothetical protein